MAYSTIAILYNPISTGNSKALAETFKQEVLERFPDQDISIIPTEYAGHDEELAYSLSHEHAHPLIISSSGDGGYNNIVNGIMKAIKEGADPVAGLLPAGNANDHYRNLHDSDIIDAIATGAHRAIDVLKLTGTHKGRPFERYAHSYIGFGFTPAVGRELNRNTLNIFNQVWIVAKALLSTRAVSLVLDEKRHSYDSIIVSNVDTMSKVLKISQPSRVDDGKFEVTIFRKRNKFQLIGLLLHASIVGAKHDIRTDRFALKTVYNTLVQLDGEIESLDGATDVTITVEKQALPNLV